MQNRSLHQPVLPEQVMQMLQPQAGESYLDLTAGQGGHAALVFALTQNEVGATLVDRDRAAIEGLKQRFSKATIVNNNFATAAQELKPGSFDMILMDLGISSVHVDNSDRGFSFNKPGPLDMRMDQTQGQTAADIVNTYPERDLADLIYQLGEERRSRPIARAIVNNRPIHTTEELAETVRRTYHNYSKIHPATKTFQALRMAVNDELGQLEQTLPRLPELLRPDGRLVIISFHSLEDRMVKHYLRGEERLEVLTKKVVKGSEYDNTNPRARSAKLRAARKI